MIRDWVIHFPAVYSATSLNYIFPSYKETNMLKDGEKGVILQRDKINYAVAPHNCCGMLTPADLRKFAEIADEFGVSAIKITSAARIALIGLKEEQVDKVWARLNMKAGAATGLCVRSVKACPGTSFCRFGMQDSLKMGRILDDRYHGMELPGKLKFGVSGCANQCAETCIKDIALVGTKSGWRLLAGGNGGGKPRLSVEIRRGLSDEEALDKVDKIITWYRQNAKPNKRLGALLERTNLEDFKQAVLEEP
jgi:NAD(P)H-nitrite reductase large subunit